MQMRTKRTKHEHRLWIEAFLLSLKDVSAQNAADAADAADLAVARYLMWRDKPEKDETP